MKYFYLITSCFLFFTNTFISQSGNEKLIDVNFRQATISQFINDIETKTNYHFYYNTTIFNSMRISLLVSQKSGPTILDLAFKNTTYYFTISGNEILLTKGRAIQTELATGFFSNSTRAGLPTNIASFDDNNVKKAVTTATTESKLYPIGTPNGSATGKATISGYIRDTKTVEALIGASLYEPAMKTGTVTDQFGHFALRLPNAKHTLFLRAVGMKDANAKLYLFGRTN